MCSKHVAQLLVRTMPKHKNHTTVSCVTVGPTGLSSGANSGNNNNNDDDDEENNRNVLIGVLVPVIFILLVVVTILTIGIVFVVKR